MALRPFREECRLFETLGKGAGDGKGGLTAALRSCGGNVAEFAETHAQGAYIAP